MAERPPLPFSSPEQASSATPFGSPLEPVAAPRQLKPPPGETYVVKVQKDQIYRIPPPENAYLAERYRTERGGGGQRAGDPACSPCVQLTVGLAVTAALLLGAGIALFVVVLRPYPPSFSVDRLSVHNASAQYHVDYDFFLTAINPNKVTALWYKDGGKATLLHQWTALAKGGVGKPEEGGEDATDFNVLLHAVGHPPPKGVEKALSSGSKKGSLVALELAVDVPVQVHVGALGFQTTSLAVVCDIRTAGLRKDVHISSQNCRSSFDK
ncbi:NDR1/HIN1-like protein 13 [Lolium rigidum]|uniref:NDR1/HIN1-like protein 13 n=1 Tax=Lolium rigidum TaxID=89674 RepID=UPI001F5CD423|nr:NDR1/HIN1-like protein 13 [Lolium rigidum]